jgi:hypothetical protein
MSAVPVTQPMGYPQATYPMSYMGYPQQAMSYMPREFNPAVPPVPLCRLRCLRNPACVCKGAPQTNGLCDHGRTLGALLLTMTFADARAIAPVTTAAVPETRYVTEDVRAIAMQTVVENQVRPKGLKIPGPSPPAHMAARKALTHEPHAINLARPARRELGPWSRLALGEEKSHVIACNY